jgi:hypothetical protein
MRTNPTTESPRRQALEFLVPLTAARPATQEEGGGEWILIMPVGRWLSSHLAQGIYEITAADIAELERNFAARVKGVDLPVYEGHWPGPALGWIQELRSTSAGLDARVTWTQLGRQMREQDLYRYCSPGWYDLAWPYVIAASGQKIPWVLDHLGITNNPFFVELPGIAERRDDGTLVYSPLTAVWEETENQIRHRVRDPEDFRSGTFRTKKLSPSAVRKVDVSFTITSAMADGVTMVLGKLKPENVPDGHDPDSMVLQSVRFVKKTDEQDGWTMAQAKQWYGKSGFSSATTERNLLMAEPAAPPAPPAPPAAPDAPSRLEEANARITELEAQLAARDAALDTSRQQNEDLGGRVDSLEADRERTAVRSRIAAMRFGPQGDRAIASAHIDKLVEVAMALPADKREEYLSDLQETFNKGLVPLGEVGSAAGTAAPQPGLDPRQQATNAQMGVTDEVYNKWAGKYPEAFKPR